MSGVVKKAMDISKAPLDFFKADAPKPPKSQTMPDPNSTEAKKAAQRRAQRRRRSGRTSTVLTGESTLG